jgi:hypothetical protein
VNILCHTEQSVNVCSIRYIWDTCFEDLPEEVKERARELMAKECKEGNKGAKLRAIQNAAIDRDASKKKASLLIATHIFGHGSAMSRSWPGHGPVMARPWPDHGPFMNRQWPNHCRATAGP